MKNKKSKVAVLAMAMTMAMSQHKYNKKYEEYPENPKAKVLPRGCREFEFDDPYFVCVASNEKNAEKKYNNFKKILALNN